MTETFGSQLFGPWYDIIGLALVSAGSYYLAFAAETMPLSAKARLPGFLLNRKFCIGIGTIMAALALYKAVTIPIAAAAATPPETWVKIDSNGSGDSIFVMRSSLSRSGDLVEYWSKITFKDPRTVGPSLRASVLMDRHAANCKVGTISHVRSLGISEKGQSIDFPLAAKDKEAAPVPGDKGHPDAILFRYVCS